MQEFTEYCLASQSCVSICNANNDGYQAAMFNLIKWLCFEEVVLLFVWVFLYGKRNVIIVCLVFPRSQGRGGLRQLNQR